MKKIIVKTIIKIIFIQIISMPLFSNWLDNNWMYRKEFTIQNSTTTLTDFQFYLTRTSSTIDSLISGGRVSQDLKDVRFTKSDGTTLLNYCFDIDTTNLLGFYIKFDEIPANSSTTFYMYYGNDNAYSVASVTSTLVFFEDFSGDLSNWKLIQGSAPYINTDKSLNIYDNGVILTKVAISSFTIKNYILEYNAKNISGVSNIFHFIALNRLQNDGTTYVETTVRGPNANDMLFGGFNPQTPLLNAISSNTVYSIKIESFENKMLFKIFNSSKSTTIGSLEKANVSLFSAGSIGFASWIGARNNIDNVRVLNYVLPVPYIKSASSENINLPLKPTIISISSTTLIIQNNLISSPPGIKFSVKISSQNSNLYLQDDKTVGINEVFKTSINWGDFLIKDIIPNTTYTICVGAKSADDYFYGYSESVTTITYCAVPINFNISSINTSTATIIWSNNNNPLYTDYIVGNYNTNDSTQTKNLYWIQTGLLPNTSYYYSIKARNIDGNLTNNLISNTTFTASVIPSGGFYNSISSNSITISWNSNGNPENTLYSIERGTNVLVSTTSFFYTDNNLICNTSYYYRIKSQNYYGLYSDYFTLQSTYTLANIPSGGYYSDVSTMTIKIHWSNNNNNEDTIYFIEKDSGVGFFQCNSTTSTEYLDTSVIPNMNYYYKVRARNLNGIYTNYLILDTTYTLANIPSNGYYSDITTGTIKLNWSGNNNQINTLYSVEKDSGTGYFQYTTTVSTGFIDSYLLSNASYYYRIRTKNAENYSGYLYLGSTFTLVNIPSDGYFSNITTSTIQFVWSSNNNSNYTEYYIQKDSGTGIFSYSSTKFTNFTDTGLIPNTSYYFRIFAKNISSGFSNYLEIGSTFTLSTVLNNAYYDAISSNTLRLNWELNDNPADCVIVIERNNFEIATTSGMFYIDKNLQPNTSYYYKVKVKYQNNNYSNYLIFNTTYTKSNIPINLTFISVGISSISFSFSGNSNSDDTEYFAVCYSTDESNISEWKNTSLFNFVNLSGNKEYKLKVKSRNKSNIETEYSYSISTYTYANIPANHSISNFPEKTDDSISIRWGENNNYTGTYYKVFISSSENFEKSYNNTGWILNNNYQFSGLESNKRYHFFIKAKNIYNIETSAYYLGTEITENAKVSSPDSILFIKVQSGAPENSEVNISTIVSNEIKSEIDKSETFLLASQNIRTIYINKNTKQIFPVYEIKLQDKNTQNEINFSGAAKIEISYFLLDNNNDGKIDNTNIDVKYLKIFRYDTIEKRWRLIPGDQVINLSNKIISTNINSFSLYTLMLFEAPVSVLEKVRNFPNPFNPLFEKTRISYILTQNSDIEIRIFNSIGDLVFNKKISSGKEGAKGWDEGYFNIFDWDGKNNEGMIVANGGYICQIIAEPDNQKGKKYKEIRKIAVLK